MQDIHLTPEFKIHFHFIQSNHAKVSKKTPDHHVSSSKIIKFLHESANIKESNLSLNELSESFIDFLSFDLQEFAFEDSILSLFSKNGYLNIQLVSDFEFDQSKQEELIFDNKALGFMKLAY